MKKTYIIAFIVLAVFALVHSAYAGRGITSPVKSSGTLLGGAQFRPEPLLTSTCTLTTTLSSDGMHYNFFCPSK